MLPASGHAGTNLLPTALSGHSPFHEEADMGRYMLLWLLGVPIPILVLIWAFGGLH